MRAALAFCLLGLSTTLVNATSHHKNGTCSAHGHRKKGSKSKGSKKTSAAAAAKSVSGAAATGSSTHKNATVSSGASSIVSNVTSGLHSLIQVTDSQCGATGATLQSNTNGGPNGAATWLTCGISQSNPNGGWNPPTIMMNQLVYKTLEQFQSSTFSACSPYIDIFNKYGKQYGIPPIFLASFAMSVALEYIYLACK